jgi:hypothetical protein
MRRALLGVLLIALPLVPIVFAQSPAFEVASIKPHPDTAGGPFRILPGGRVQAESVNLKTLVQRAYRLHAFQVVGPDWMTTDRFDIDAKASSEAAKASSTSEEVAKVSVYAFGSNRVGFGDSVAGCLAHPLQSWRDSGGGGKSGLILPDSLRKVVEAAGVEPARPFGT